MNESEEKWENGFLIVCAIITVIACFLAFWITVQNAKYVEEIKGLKSEIGQAYFIEEGTVISASEERQILSVKLDHGDIVWAKVWSLEVKVVCDAYKWKLEGVRIFILRNKAENEYVVLTIFGREQNANTVVY